MRTLPAHCAACGLLAGLGAAPAPADWTHLGGDAARTSIAPAAPTDFSNLRATAAAAPDEEFIGRASPIFVAGVVWLTARRYEDSVQVANELIAIDAADGSRRWTATLLPDVLDSYAAPAFDLRNGNVLVGSDHRLYAFRAADGIERWHADLQRAIVNASPAISDDLSSGGVPANRAFITDFNGLGTATLYAVNLDPHDAAHNPHQPGEIAWTAPLPAASGNSPAYADGVVYVATPAGTVHAFAAGDGSPLWTTTLASAGYSGFGGFFGGVTVRGGFVYAATYDFYGAGDNSGLFKLDAFSGAIQWGVACERTDAIPVVAGDGRIYLAAGLDDFGSAVKVQAFDDLGAGAVRAWDTDADSGGALQVGGWTAQLALSGARLFAGAPDPADLYGPYTSAELLDVSATPADPGFILAAHAGAGGSAAIADGCAATVGIDGLFIFCAALCTGDVNGDGVVDLTDLSAVLAAFGASQGDPDYNAAADFNGDGLVDLTDLSLLLAAFGTPCS